MRDKERASPLAILLKELDANSVAKASGGLEQKVKAFASAETKAERRTGAKTALFLVSYRVGEETSKTKGKSDVRRGNLVTLIQSREPLEEHLSTSTWIIRSYMKAAALINILADPLDENNDFLSVAEVTLDRARFGNAGLQS